MTKRAFVDTDIILDLLSQRAGFYDSAARLFTLADQGSVHLFVSSLIFSNIYYVLRKQKNRQFALSSLQKLKNLVKILPVDEKIIELSLISNFNDFEDAIQYHTAKAHNINYLITRNIKDYRRADIIACTAEEYLNTIKFK
jgi:predicted nucleic acid-binding protein